MRTHNVVLSSSFLGFILLMGLAIVPVECAYAVLSQEELAVSSRAVNSADSATRAKVVKHYGNLPLHFEANRGQTDERVRFLSRGHGYTLFLTGNEAVLSLRVPQNNEKTKENAYLRSGDKENGFLSKLVRMSLTGSNPRAEMVGQEKLPGRVNYLTGNDPDRWSTNVPTYKKVYYKDIYPGIDLVYYGKQGSLEYDLVVNPGADHNSIKIAFKGIDHIEIDKGGNLLLHTSSGDVVLRKPSIYQKIDGLTREIDGGYVLLDTKGVSFRVGEYDTRVPLIIDPVLVYSTYLGG